MNTFIKAVTSVISGVMFIGSALAYIQLTAFVLLILLIVAALIGA